MFKFFTFCFKFIIYGQFNQYNVPEYKGHKKDKLTDKYKINNHMSLDKL